MLPRLVLTVRPIRLPATVRPRRHRCRTRGANLHLVNTSRQMLMTAIIGTIDRPCLEMLSRESVPPARRIQFPLTFIMPWGPDPVRWRVDGHPWVIRAGRYGVLNPHEHAEMDGHQGFHGAVVTITQTMLRECREAIDIPKIDGPFGFQGAVRNTPKSIRKVIASLRELAEASSGPVTDPFAAWGVWSAGFCLLRELWETHPSSLRSRWTSRGGLWAAEPRLQEMLKFLEDHAFEPLTVTAMVNASGFSRAELFRQFKRHLGLSPQGWIRRRRVEEAERLLAASSFPGWKTVADRVGFQSTWALKKAIKQVRGTLPNFR